MKVAIYARVSTADQSPESQLNELREFAKRRKLKVSREYVDQASGRVERRKRAPEYECLMQDAHLGKFDCVLVWKFDRFARSLSALLSALKTFEALQINFISATQQIDTTTPMGRLFFSIVGSFAEFEREMIVERTRAGLANARRRGRIPGPKLSLSVNSEIRKLRASGCGIREIARKVNRSPAGVMRILRALPPAGKREQGD